jgi:protein TonB
MNVTAVCVAAIVCVVSPIAVRAQDATVALAATAVTVASQASAWIAGLSATSLQALPGFPVKAYRDGYREGRVRLGFTVRSDGTVDAVQVLDAHPVQVFTRSAANAVSAWRFFPTGIQEQRTVEFRFAAE